MAAFDIAVGIARLGLPTGDRGFIRRRRPRPRSSPLCQGGGPTSSPPASPAPAPAPPPPPAPRRRSSSASSAAAPHGGRRPRWPWRPGIFGLLCPTSGRVLRANLRRRYRSAPLRRRCERVFWRRRRIGLGLSAHPGRKHASNAVAILNPGNAVRFSFQAMAAATGTLKAVFLFRQNVDVFIATIYFHSFIQRVSRLGSNLSKLRACTKSNPPPLTYIVGSRTGKSTKTERKREKKLRLLSEKRRLYLPGTTSKPFESERASERLLRM